MVKSANFITAFDHLIISFLCLLWVPACEASQVLMEVPYGFSRGSSVFAPPTDLPVSKELERGVKLNM